MSVVCRSNSHHKSFIQSNCIIVGKRSISSVSDDSQVKKGGLNPTNTIHFLISLSKMSHRTRNTRHAIESCTLQLHTWRPFQFQPTQNLDSAASSLYSTVNSFRTKRPCCADRSSSYSIEPTLDISRLSLFDDDRSLSSVGKRCLFAKKRRRRGSRSISGRSSDRSGTNRQRCCSVGASAAYGTCSDFPVAAATDSSGELFVNGDANWSSDVSEAGKNNARKVDRDSGSGEKDNTGSGVVGQAGNLDGLGNESGYGSEPGYRGDVEYGYGDEIDEEEDNSSLLFWEDEFGDAVPNMERSGENTLQKAHHRGRRRKHDVRMLDVVR